MYYTSRDYRLKARTTMKPAFWRFIGMAALYMVAVYFIGWLADELSGVNAWNRELSRRLSTYMTELQTITDPAELQAIIERISMPSFTYFSKGIFALGLSWLISLMAGPLGAGYTFHLLQESRGNKTSVGVLMYGFRITFKVIGLQLLMGILTALGMILFIVPGIILMLRWSLAMYVLLDDPSKGVIQCMKESGRLTSGGKWRIFKLQLSFFWWYLLSALVTSLTGFPIMDLYLTPYTGLAMAHFYNEQVGVTPVVNDIPWEL